MIDSSRAEILDLVKKYQEDQNRNIFNKLYKHYKKLITNHINNKTRHPLFASNDALEKNDLLTYALTGFQKALNKFEQEKGELTSWIAINIDWAISLGLIIDSPFSETQNKLNKSIRKTINSFYIEHGIFPEIGDIAKELNIEKNKIEDALQLDTAINRSMKIDETGDNNLKIDEDFSSFEADMENLQSLMIHLTPFEIKLFNDYKESLQNNKLNLKQKYNLTYHRLFMYMEGIFLILNKYK